MSKTATEHPILFNAEMVRVILDGRKTVTRRVVKPQPVGVDLTRSCLCGGGVMLASGHFYGPLRCPYGSVSSRLWVRETFAFEKWQDGMSPNAAGTAGCVYGADMLRWYRADSVKTLKDLICSRGKWRRSIFMPRWASRINLEVVSVRVERVQDISEEDAAAEGVDANAYLCSRNDEAAEHAHRDAFADLWDSINGKPREDGTDISWAANPWVWRIEFKRVTP